MAIKVGQHVKFVWHPMHAHLGREVPIPADNELQYGDRFTVTEVLSDGLLILMFHKNGKIRCLAPMYVGLVTYGPEPAGAPRGSFTMLRALSDVLKHEMPSAVQDVILDLERARMTAEDFRQGNGPAVEVSKSNDEKVWVHQREWTKVALARLMDAEVALSNIRAEIRG